MTNTIPLSTAALAVTLLAAASAGAVGVNRAWVSGHGTDAAGCGAPTDPCRSLQYVHDNIIAAGGEIDILDPAGYGAVTITKAISIVNDGVGTAGVQASSGNAITITAGVGDSVTLRGLNIDGLGSAHDGIGLAQAGQLSVVNCVIRHFAHDGMDLEPTNAMKLSVTAVTAADNGANGFEVSPGPAAGAQGIVDHAYAINNGANGLLVWGVSTAALVEITTTFDDFSSNQGAGILSRGASNTQVVVKDDVSDYNAYGYDIQTGSTLVFTGSEAITNSVHDVFIESGGDGASFGDNQFNHISGTLSPTISH